MRSVKDLLTVSRLSRPEKPLTNGTLKGKQADAQSPGIPRRPSLESQGPSRSLFSKAITALASGFRRRPAAETVVVQSGGTGIPYQTALEARNKIVGAWRANRDLIEKRFVRADKKAESTGNPPPKFVTTKYASRARVLTRQGEAIDLRGMTNYHYRSNAEARAEGSPRTLSHFTEIPTEGAESGSSNTVTLGPRGFVHRALKEGSPIASDARDARSESAQPSEYGDLESFVPAIYVQENVGIARNAGELVRKMTREGRALPLQAFQKASRDLDALNGREFSYRDLHTGNLMVSTIANEPTVRFIDCDLMPRFRPDGNRHLDAAKFVQCVFEATMPGRPHTKRNVNKFVKCYVKPAFREEVKRSLLGALHQTPIRHPTQELFVWQ